MFNLLDDDGGRSGVTFCPNDAWLWFIWLAAATAAAARLSPWCRNCSNCSIRKSWWGREKSGPCGTNWLWDNDGGSGIRSNPNGLVCKSGGGNNGWWRKPGGGRFCCCCCCCCNDWPEPFEELVEHDELPLRLLLEVDDEAVEDFVWFCCCWLGFDDST